MTREQFSDYLKDNSKSIKDIEYQEVFGSFIFEFENEVIYIELGFDSDIHIETRSEKITKAKEKREFMKDKINSEKAYREQIQQILSRQTPEDANFLKSIIK